MKLDQKDHLIIKVLRDNSRSSVRDIAKLTKLRPSTVHQRLTKLKKNGVIEKFTLKVNNKAMGENFIVFVLVTASKDLDNKVFVDEHIKEVFGVTGEYDLLLKVKFKDVEDFNDFIIKFRKQNNLRKTLTMVVTTNIKEEI
jgi:DNA-binding Lrp family transcriptional regulator|tara:strand:- start:88 stop:510 length:423 start_codon:yes stop_codon:yes gene_type:complete